MDVFTRDDLRSLIEADADPCASIYMPTHRAGREIREDSLRCKNLLHKAEEQLHEAGLRTPEARAALEPAHRLQGDGQFWRNQSDGLAIFAGRGIFKSYRVPLRFEELLVVNRRFHVKQILPLLQNDGTFYILAVSQKHVRLLRGTHHSVSELDPVGLPKSLVDALNVDEYVQSLQQHGHTTLGVGAAGAREGLFHGHGGADLDVKKRDEIIEYFRRIDDGLHEFFKNVEHAPLVFAGVEYQFPMFKDSYHQGPLIDKPVAGNSDDLQLRELHAKAWQLVGPHFREGERKAIRRYGERAGGDVVSNDLQEIIKAARTGRVETLFVSEDQKIWGSVDEGTGEMQRLHEGLPGTDDLLDYAAVHTLLTGGEVFAVHDGEMPGGGAVAAVYRYPSRFARQA